MIGLRLKTLKPCAEQVYFYICPLPLLGNPGIANEHGLNNFEFTNNA